MKRKTLAIVVSLATLLGLNGAAAAGEGNRIEGTWINEVKIVSCQSPQTVVAQFQSLTTYMRGGTSIEGGGPSAPPPAVSRSAGHGIWELIGGHELHTHFRFHSFDSLGRLVRITEVDNELTLFLGDNPQTTGVVEPYYLSGQGISRITNLDPIIGAVTSVIDGCNDASARPMLF